MTLSEIDAVVSEIRIAASPQDVFAYFVDPDKMVRWIGTRVALDPRPGGAYAIDMNTETRARGRYVEVVPHSRVVFTWGWEGQETGEHAVAPGSSRVEVDLTPDGDGTLVRLRHLDLPEQSREIHGQGWDMYLGRLAAAAEGRDPAADPSGPDNE